MSAALRAGTGPDWVYHGQRRRESTDRWSPFVLPEMDERASLAELLRSLDQLRRLRGETLIATHATYCAAGEKRTRREILEDPTALRFVPLLILDLDSAALEHAPAAAAAADRLDMALSAVVGRAVRFRRAATGGSKGGLHLSAPLGLVHAQATRIAGDFVRALARAAHVPLLSEHRPKHGRPPVVLDDTIWGKIGCGHVVQCYGPRVSPEGHTGDKIELELSGEIVDEIPESVLRAFIEEVEKESIAQTRRSRTRRPTPSLSEQAAPKIAEPNDPLLADALQALVQNVSPIWSTAHGHRHDAALAFAGALGRSWVPAELAERTIVAVAAAADDEEAISRGVAVRSTYSALERGRPCTGIVRFTEIMGREARVALDRFLNTLDARGYTARPTAEGDDDEDAVSSGSPRRFRETERDRQVFKRLIEETRTRAVRAVRKEVAKLVEAEGRATKERGARYGKRIEHPEALRRLARWVECGLDAIAWKIPGEGPNNADRIHMVRLLCKHPLCVVCRSRDASRASAVALERWPRRVLRLVVSLPVSSEHGLFPDSVTVQRARERSIAPRLRAVGVESAPLVVTLRNGLAIYIGVPAELEEMAITETRDELQEKLAEFRRTVSAAISWPLEDESRAAAPALRLLSAEILIRSVAAQIYADDVVDCARAFESYLVGAVQKLEEMDEGEERARAMQGFATRMFATVPKLQGRFVHRGRSTLVSGLNAKDQKEVLGAGLPFNWSKVTETVVMRGSKKIATFPCFLDIASAWRVIEDHVLGLLEDPESDEAVEQAALAEFDRWRFRNRRRSG